MYRHIKENVSSFVNFGVNAFWPQEESMFLNDGPSMEPKKSTNILWSTWKVIFREKERHKKKMVPNKNFDFKKMIFSHICIYSSYEFTEYREPLLKMWILLRCYSKVDGWIVFCCDFFCTFMWIKTCQFCLKAKINKCCAIRWRHILHRINL